MLFVSKWMKSKVATVKSGEMLIRKDVALERKNLQLA